METFWIVSGLLHFPWENPCKADCWEFFFWKKWDSPWRSVRDASPANRSILNSQRITPFAIETPCKADCWEYYFFEKNETRLGDRFVTPPLPIETFSIVSGLLHLSWKKTPVKLTVENIFFGKKKTRLGDRLRDASSAIRRLEGEVAAAQHRLHAHALNGLQQVSERARERSCVWECVTTGLCCKRAL